MITLFLQGKKGHEVLSAALESIPELLSEVIIGNDRKVINDYSEEMLELLKPTSVPHQCSKKVKSFNSKWAFAIGWQLLITPEQSQQLVVFHDSLLPRLRGFNPLVTALINGDEAIGVTAIGAVEEYDRGPILGQVQKEVTYPITIQEAIELISEGYVELFKDLSSAIAKGEELSFEAQNEDKATYSLWRDNRDYRVDWSWDATKIERFVNAVGYPYEGAQSMVQGNQVFLRQVTALKDVPVENREPGKVIFKREGKLVVVAGKGLVQIDQAEDHEGNPLLFETKFRIRFE